jgi:nucleoside-diphosphate-sugar epimerase
VRRALDGRRRVVLVDRGESRFHTTSARNLAELVFQAALRPADRVVNCADPDAPTTLEICAAIGEALGHRFEPFLLEASGFDRPELANPWSIPRPLVLDLRRAADELGYSTPAPYAEAVAETCDWLARAAREHDWSDTYLARYFD